MILKSPTHGYRVTTLRKLLPEARFVLIVRDPLTIFESVIRMWRTMFETYAITAVPTDDEIREAVIADRPRFEAKLVSGTAGLSTNRFVAITYESLVANPMAVIEQLYQQLELGDFSTVRETLAAETKRRGEYRAKGSLPSEKWKQRITAEWSHILADHAALQLQCEA
jgi:hypothetical protein